MWFFVDSMEHVTTQDQAQDKWSVMTAPTVAAGAFGQPGSRPPSGGDIYNFPIKDEFVLSIHWIPDPNSGNLVLFRNTSSGDQGGGGEQLYFQIIDDGTIKVFGGTIPFVGRPLLGQSIAGAVAFNVQHHLRLAFTVHSSTGTIKVDLDGDRIVDLTGKNTNQNGSGGVTQISLWGDGETGQGRCYWSHAGFGDEETDGDGLQPRVSAVWATEDGFYVGQMTQVGGVGGPFTAINEHSPDLANYLEATAAGQKASFKFANNLPVLSRILAIGVTPLVGKTDAASRAGRSFFRMGGVDFFYPTNKAVPSSPAYLQQVWNECPQHPGNEFTPAEANAPIEAGWEAVT